MASMTRLLSLQKTDDDSVMQQSAGLLYLILKISGFAVINNGAVTSLLMHRGIWYVPTGNGFTF